MPNTKIKIDNTPVVEDADKNYIAGLIQEGFTSGQFLGEDGARIAWSIEIDIID